MTTSKFIIMITSSIIIILTTIAISTPQAKKDCMFWCEEETRWEKFVNFISWSLGFILSSLQAFIAHQSIQFLLKLVSVCGIYYASRNMRGRPDTLNQLAVPTTATTSDKYISNAMSSNNSGQPSETRNNNSFGSILQLMQVHKPTSCYKSTRRPRATKDNNILFFDSTIRRAITRRR